MIGSPTWELVASHDGTTEGPSWTGSRFLYSEIPASRIWSYDIDRGSSRSWRTDTEGTNGLWVDNQGGVLGCQGLGRRIVRYVPGHPTETIVDRFAGTRFNEPNDLVVDSSGRIWFSDPNYYERPIEQDCEAVYRADPTPDGWTAQRMTTDTNRPNGVLLSADESWLYVADSPKDPKQRRDLRRYPIGGDGSLGPAEVLHDFGVGRGVDGMCRAEDGLVIATAGQRSAGAGPALYLFDAAGVVVATVPTPADKPTNCAFGGPDLDVLMVTFGGGQVYLIRDTGLRGE